jgi:hypothetical protein
MIKRLLVVSAAMGLTAAAVAMPGMGPRTGDASAGSGCGMGGGGHGMHAMADGGRAGRHGGGVGMHGGIGMHGGMGMHAGMGMRGGAAPGPRDESAAPGHSHDAGSCPMHGSPAGAACPAHAPAQPGGK